MTPDEQLEQLHIELRDVVLAEDWWDRKWASQLADLAIRRWRSFDRRNKANNPTLELRVRDLVKGLRQGYPGDIIYVEPGSLERLALRCSEVLIRAL